MRVLLTRPIDDSQLVAKMLRDKNITVHVAPLMQIKYLPHPEIEVDRYQAVIFTSAYGVRAYHSNHFDKNKHFYVVGQRTAKIAQNLDLNKITSTNSDVKKLSEKIITELNPKDGPLLYLSGVHVAGNLTETLQRAGFNIDRESAYEAIMETHFANETKKLIKSGSFDYIPFYSPRSAIIFERLIESSALQNTLSSVTALCLSHNVEKELDKTRWKQILVAKKPTQEDLFNLMGLTL